METYVIILIVVGSMAVFILLVLLLRGVVLWYYKISEREATQKLILLELRKLVALVEKSSH